MRCPICRKEIQPDNPFAPFCSDRCRIIDLGNWASEKYMISTPADPQEVPDTAEEEDDRE
jgi:endogenous inhibitor of DNA gyrase (YacG/DUF329 family)